MPTCVRGTTRICTSIWGSFELQIGKTHMHSNAVLYTDSTSYSRTIDLISKELKSISRLLSADVPPQSRKTRTEEILASPAVNKFVWEAHDLLFKRGVRPTHGTMVSFVLFACLAKEGIEARGDLFARREVRVVVPA
jgi:hypothetical protein